MKNKIIFVITLLLILIGLVSADLLTGIFYWNRANLSFDPSTFNNLLSPIASICASIIYGITLFFIIKQTKIFRSQSIKPHFENEIQLLQKKYESIEMYSYRNGKAQILKPNEIIYELSNSIKLVMLNSDFSELQEKLSKNFNYKNTDIEDSSYYEEIFLLLSLLKESNSYENFNYQVHLLIDEVRLSTMTNEDKTFIIRKTINIFFKSDLNLLNEIIRNNQSHIILPILHSSDDDNVASIILSESSFYKNMVRIKNILLEFTPEQQ